MKRAFLVEYNIRTRVVVDVPDLNEVEGPFGLINEEIENEIAKASQNNILNDPASYICYDNIVYVEADSECPAGTFDND